MNQLDELAHLLEESGQSRPAHVRASRSSAVRRRVILGGGAVATVGLAGGAAWALSARLGAAPDLQGSAVPGSPAVATATPVALPAGVGGEVVWSGAQGQSLPVLAPGGTGAIVDSEGRVQILGAEGVLATSLDVLPEAALVAGELDGQDVIAWATGKVVSWWTAANGLQRAQHTRQLGLTAVGGGVLVFDDAQWSGRLQPTEVIALTAATDSLTIGVRPDGSSIAATTDGVLTVTPPDSAMQILQPVAPSAGARVWRVAGIVGEHAVIIWDEEGGDSAPVSVMSVETGIVTGSGQVARDAVESAKLRRSTSGCELAGLRVSTTGAVSDSADGAEVTGTAGGVLTGTRGAEAVWIDVDAGTCEAAPESLTWQMLGQNTGWSIAGETVWFVNRSEKGNS